MQVHVALPASANWRISPDKRMSDSRFLAFCRANPDLRVERDPNGEITIVPPAGGESGQRNLKVGAQLSTWADQDGRGEAFDSSTMFMLPDGSALCPDAAWVSNEALRTLTAEQRREFLRVCPQFVIEVMSPSDRLKTAQTKMERWISNGTQLAWLIDADHETVYIYRPGRPPLTRKGIKQLAGSGPVAGFTLKLERIWKGLS